MQQQNRSSSATNSPGNSTAADRAGGWLVSYDWAWTRERWRSRSRNEQVANKKARAAQVQNVCNYRSCRRCRLTPLRLLAMLRPWCLSQPCQNIHSHLLHQKVTTRQACAHDPAHSPRKCACACVRQSVAFGIPMDLPYADIYSFPSTGSPRTRFVQRDSMPRKRTSRTRTPAQESSGMHATTASIGLQSPGAP